jgi:hypothetical protein
MFSLSVFLISIIFIILWITPQSAYTLYFGRSLNLSSGEQLQTSFMPNQIAATENGSVYVVWVDTNNIYFTSSHDNGTKFDSPVPLSKSNNSASSPQIAATENGSVYVVWVDTNNIYFTSSHDNGTKFDSPVPLSKSNNSASSPQIAATENGSVYVVWVDTNSTSGDSDILFRASTDSGEKFGRKELSRDGRDSPPLLSSSPQIAATENGSVYVVWVDTNITNRDSDILFRGSMDRGEHFGRKEISRDEYNISSSSPQMSATESGKVYVVWIDKNSTNADSDILLKTITHSKIGDEFGRNIHLNRNPEQISTSSSPQVAANEGGNVYSVWTEDSLQFKEGVDNATIFSETIPPSAERNLVSSPQIATSENGRIYIVWVEENRSNGDRTLYFKGISQFLFERHS